MPNRLEQYLEEVSEPVAAPYRSEWREEVRQHVESLTSAYQELGHTHEEATELALHQFGEAQTVGKEVQKRMARPVTLVEAVFGFLWPVTICFFLFSFSILGWALGVIRTGDETGVEAIALTGSLMKFLVPALAGWWMARRLQGRMTVRQILTGAAIGVPLCFLQMAFFYVASTRFYPPNLLLVVAQMPLWFAIAAGTAFVTRRLSRPRKVVRI